jgi:hypothetical protein
VTPYEDPITAAELGRDVLAAEIEEPAYTRSTGERVPLSKLSTPHLKSAFRKLQFEQPDHHELPAMEAEIVMRDAEYAARQAEEQQ